MLFLTYTTNTYVQLCSISTGSFVYQIVAISNQTKHEHTMVCLIWQYDNTGIYLST